MNLVNGIAVDVIGLRDRGLSYGDGVFRTFLLRAGKPLWWRRHYAKLAHDCGRLAIECPDIAILESDLALIAQASPDCVAKIIITRGESARGYAPSAAQIPTRIATSGLLPEHPAHYWEQGVHTHLCRLRLAHQPALAGAKHLNRLENVLARAEWNDAAIAEGLLCDVDDNLIGGTMSNVFLIKDGGLFTPDLTLCGVSGVMRDVVLELASRHEIPAHTTKIGIDELLAADEVFVANSVIGLWPVAALDRKAWAAGPLTARFLNWIRDAQRD
jgi:4-amino-4-deoxychorismate lyase